MNIQRKWVTPVTAGAFLLSAVTGVLIFFHLDSGLNKPFHEWMGLVLITGAALHVTANFSGLKSHLAVLRGKFLFGIFVVALLVSFSPIGGEGELPFMPPMRALSQSSLATLAQVAKVTPEQLRDKLVKAGLQPTSNEQSVSELVGPDMKRQVQVLGMVFAAAK